MSAQGKQIASSCLEKNVSVANSLELLFLGVSLDGLTGCVIGGFKIRKLEATVGTIVVFSLPLTCVALLQSGNTA